MNLPLNAAVWCSWLGIFLALEIPAVFGLTPWRTLSEFVWALEADWPAFTVLFLLFFAGLLVHLVARWTP